MKLRDRHLRTTATAASMLLLAALALPASAHCDSMGGPVVIDAQRALSAKTVDPVLKWVPAKDTQAVQQAFDKTLAVRGESETAKELADHYFFEAVIRLHRASEGEGFTGIKPADAVEPGIAAADEALKTGDIDPLADKLSREVREAVLQRFKTAHTSLQSADKSTEQGRKFVADYVQFTHFVENLDHLVTVGASHQHRETEDQLHAHAR